MQTVKDTINSVSEKVQEVSNPTTMIVARTIISH